MRQFFATTKGAVILLTLGTFLEYFDLSLFQHMAIVLNQLFFPSDNHQLQAILDSVTFTLPYALRPLGMILLGYLGDKYGRKSIIIWTTSMMAISCIIMGCLPTYAEIGISAGIIMLACRTVQSLTSGSERVSAEVYLTEITSPPNSYPLVACISWVTSISTMVALALCSFVLSSSTPEQGWRFAFFIGSIIAVIGAFARSQLQEPKAFLDNKKAYKKRQKKPHVPINQIDKYLFKLKHFSGFSAIEKKTSMMFFFIQCMFPLCYYLLYSHMAFILKTTYSWTPYQIIQSSQIVAYAEFISMSFITILSYWVHPLKILKWNWILFTLFILVYPILLLNVTTGEEIHWIRVIFGSILLGAAPALPVFYSYFSIGTRLTHTSSIYSGARAFMYLLTSNAIAFLIACFDFKGIYIIMIPLTIAYYIGLRYFIKLEISRGCYVSRWDRNA